MKYKRINIRVPFIGEVSLESTPDIVIKACALDISMNGIGIHKFSNDPENKEYKIAVTAVGYGKIYFSGTLAHTYKETAGFMITNIDPANLKILKRIIADFQTTEAFIHHIDKHDIIGDWFVDSEGKEIDLTFEMSP